jgi:hypothetical protein
MVEASKGCTPCAKEENWNPAQCNFNDERQKAANPPLA